MATVRLGSGRNVQLPAEVMARLKIRPGTRLEIAVLDEGIYLVPTDRIPKDQRYFWTEEWQNKEREAERDLDGGRVHGPFDTAAEAIAALRKRPA